MSFGPDPNEIIPPTIASATAIFNAAAKMDNVKRFVYTSSCASAASPKPDTWSAIKSDTWNDEAVEQAWTPPPYGPERGFVVYAASKTESERQLWKLYEQRKPGFAFNTGMNKEVPPFVH